jgi:hypothetical protein
VEGSMVILVLDAISNETNNIDMKRGKIMIYS